MCGIAGYVRRAGGNGDLNAMLRQLQHRGPDGGGVWFGRHGEWEIGLGHRRLAILDIAGGAQPMSTDDGQVQLTFNGEIYNHLELRREIDTDHSFQSRSDTETLLQHLAATGTSALDAMNGMFAFGLWDGREATLTLVRDRAGIKPLFYAPLPCGGVVFASELTAILAYGSVPTALDTEAVTSFFFRDYVAPPRTIIAGVYKLSPGHTIQWRSTGLTAARVFWSLNDVIEADPISDADAIEQLRGRLDAAVRSQLMADVPLGVFLSGGIDSSLVAALANRQMSGELNTFSIGFDDVDYDESGFAERVAKHLGTRHTRRRFSEGDLLATLDRALDCLDEPMADPSILPTYLLSELAASHVKVALGGDGGDELWAGYPTYRAHRHASLYGRVAPPLKKLIARGINRLPTGHGYQPLDWKLKRFALRWEDDSFQRHQHWMSSASLSQLTAAIVPSNSPWTCPRYRSGDALNALLGFDFETYLPGSVLTKVDRASMAHGLEVRPPLLDNKLIRLAFSLPSSLKLRGKTTKWLLKSACRSLLPDDIIDRPKKGFAIPLARWMAGPLQPRVQQILRDSPVWATGLVRRETFADWSIAHAERRCDNSRPLWALLVLDHWLKRINQAKICVT